VVGNARRMRRGLASSELTIDYTISVERDYNPAATEDTVKENVRNAINTKLALPAYKTAVANELFLVGVSATVLNVTPIAAADISVVPLNPTAAPTTAPAAASEDKKGIVPGLADGLFFAMLGGGVAILGAAYARRRGVRSWNEVKILPTSEDGAPKAVSCR